MKHADIIQTLSLDKNAPAERRHGVHHPGAAGQGHPGHYPVGRPNGVRKQAGAADHLGLNPSVPATCFPTGIRHRQQLGMPRWARKSAQPWARKTAAQEVSVVLGTGGFNMKRNPLCGRSFEVFLRGPVSRGQAGGGIYSRTSSPRA